MNKGLLPFSTVFFFLLFCVSTTAADKKVDASSALAASGTCDAGKTKAAMYKIPAGYFVEVETADGRSFLAHDTATDALFFIQEKNSSQKNMVPEKIWRDELAKAAPNFYTSLTTNDKGDCEIKKQ